MTHRSLVLVACFAAFGCSSSTDAPAPVVDSGAETSADTGTPPADTGAETKAETSSETGADDTCGAAATNIECQRCCATNHADAYKAFSAALLGCACKAGNCDKDCATTACAATPATPDATCNTCLAAVQSGACKTDLTTACTGSGPCAPFATCANTQCAGKK